MATRFVFVFIPLVALIALEAYRKPAAPEGLLVNGVSNPLAMDRDAARFTWRSAQAGRGARQTAYQILVGQWASGFGQVGFGGIYRPGLASGHAPLVESPNLGPERRGRPYSAPAFFDTGLAQNEWTAHYIWDGTTNLNKFAYFRKTFSISNTPNLGRGRAT